jgi:Flp pilus assembly protein TadD
LELNPEDWGTHTQIGIVLLRQGLPEEAWAEIELEVDPQQKEIGSILALPALGRDAEAQQRLDDFTRENQSWAAYPIATMHAWHGDTEAAFTWLERAYQQRDGLMSTIAFDPLLNSLHGDPRWAELMDRMELPHE